MVEFSFLDKLAKQMIDDNSDNISEVLVVLPNKRAKVFLLQSLNKFVDKTVFAPQIISVEDLIQEISGIRLIDSVELIFEFYEVYLVNSTEEVKQKFDVFSNWAKTLIQDFNEIDRYLLKPEYVFSYLKDVEALKRWNLQPEETTNMIEDQLTFWEKIPLFYSAFYKHCLEKKIGYQGMVYREAVNHLNDFVERKAFRKIYFGGFNALNAAEEKIMIGLLNADLAKVFWDIDGFFLNNSYHDVGLFIRRFKKNWKNYLSQPFEWITDDFKQSKKIKIIGTPKTVGQAKIAGKIIEELHESDLSFANTALVLGDENLLMPILHSLPNSIEGLNITMGYPSKNNPAQLLISKLFKLHINAMNRNDKNHVFYYKEVLDVLEHPFVEGYLNVDKMIAVINRNNLTFFSLETLNRLKNEKDLGQNHHFFNLLFDKWDQNSIAILDRFLFILIGIKKNLECEGNEDKLSKTFVYSTYKLINRLKSYLIKYQRIDSVQELYDLYKQIIDLAEVSFEGEPLKGLQIMGVLESRVLDFENVIITSVNEGKFPAGKSQLSFIPYDVKIELGLPTYKEKDAIYSYHFYHLLFRAKNIYILYNTDNEGIDAGEKSRFITQLEIEKQPQHVVFHNIYNAVLPEKAYNEMMIEKTKLLQERLVEIATIKGFSPSSLTSYIRNPIQFYFQRVLGINETDEVEENIAVNTLGTIIHETLEKLYSPFLNKFLSMDDIHEMEGRIESYTLEQFKNVYKEGDIQKGKNLLAFEVAKRNVYNFLQFEKKQLVEGDAVKVIFLEKTFEAVIHSESFDFPIKLSGNVDRVEIRNNVLRIIDYKTGKVEPFSLKINDFEGLTTDIKNEKIIQLLCYALMFYQSQLENDLPIEVGIVSFKNLKHGFMPFGLGKGRGVKTQTVINGEVLTLFEKELSVLINEILDSNKNFKEKRIAF